MDSLVISCLLAAATGIGIEIYSRIANFIPPTWSRWLALALVWTFAILHFVTVGEKSLAILFVFFAVASVFFRSGGTAGKQRKEQEGREDDRNVIRILWGVVAMVIVFVLVPWAE